MNSLSYASGIDRLGLPESDVENILNLSDRVTYKKGSCIKNSDIGDGILIIDNGIGLTLFNFTSKIKCCSGLILPGAILVDLWFKNLDKEIKVLEDISAYKLSSKQLLSSILKNQLNLLTSRKVLTELSSHRDMALLRTALSKKQHIITFITLIFLALKPMKKDFVNIGISDACLLTGVTRQYYMKIVSELCSEGILEKKYNGLKVLNLNKLSNMCDVELIKHFSIYSRSYDVEKLKF